MTPLPEDAAARAWRAGVRLSYELGRVGFPLFRPSDRYQLLASTSHWSLVLRMIHGAAR